MILKHAVRAHAYYHSKHIYLCSLAFTIRCATCRTNGTYAPFEIQSTSSLYQLRLAVAKKLDCFPNNLVLGYQLDSDKAKMGSMSIQSDDELQMFIERMWPMLVQPRLANGKPSTCILKPIVVYFDACGTSITLDEETAHGNKKVPVSRYLYSLCRLIITLHFIDCITSIIFQAELLISIEWGVGYCITD
jgi:hypothetical protein